MLFFVEDFEGYVRAWRARWAEEEAFVRSRAARARTLAGEIAARLKQDFGARRVWLIGSLARGEFGARSDLDIVAEGIAPERFFRACGQAQAMAGEFEVDLAPYEDLKPYARASLDREGKPL